MKGILKNNLRLSRFMNYMNVASCALLLELMPRGLIGVHTNGYFANHSAEEPKNPFHLPPNFLSSVASLTPLSGGLKRRRANIFPLLFWGEKNGISFRWNFQFSSGLPFCVGEQREGGWRGLIPRESRLTGARVSFRYRLCRK